jgi:DNA-binding XRE family transcriptional regulator
MIVNRNIQIRIIRALLGMGSRSFAKCLGVCEASLTNWEKGHVNPRPENIQALGELCQKHGIGFRPSGMPVPFAECFMLKPGEFTGWDMPVSPGAKCVRAPEGDGNIASLVEGSCDSGNLNQPSPTPPCTTGNKEKRRGRPRGSKNRNRRDVLLVRLKVDAAFLASQPQIAPLLKQCGITPARVIEVLRADENDASQAVVALWDSLTPANQRLLGPEALSVAAGLTPRRLWELYNGAIMMQGLAKSWS